MLKLAIGDVKNCGVSENQFLSTIHLFEEALVPPVTHISESSEGQFKSEHLQLVDNVEPDNSTLGKLSSWGYRVRATAQIAASAVATSQIAASALATAQNAASVVVTSQIAASAVATAQHAASAIATSQIASSAVTTAQNAASAVATAAIEAKERHAARPAAEPTMEKEVIKSLTCNLFLQTSFGTFELLPATSAAATTSSILVTRLSELQPCPVQGYEFQWFRSVGEVAKIEFCEAQIVARGKVPVEWVLLKGATYAAYQPSPTDVGHRLKCLITLEKRGEHNREANEPTETTLEKRTVTCETRRCIVADVSLFNGARQALVRGAQFSNLKGRGNAKGHTFRVQIEITIIKKKVMSATTIYQLAGNTLNQIHLRPFLNVSAASDPCQPKAFDLVFPIGLLDDAGMVKALLSHHARLQLEAHNRMTRDTLLLTLGIANFPGKPCELTTSTVLYEGRETDLYPTIVDTDFCPLIPQLLINKPSEFISPEETKLLDAPTLGQSTHHDGVKASSKNEAEKTLLKHLDLNPFIAAEAAKLDEETVSNLADLHESIFKARYHLPTFSPQEQMYPLTAICLLGAKLPLVEKTYKIFPEAADEAIKFAHAYTMDQVMLLVESRPKCLVTKDEHGHIPLHRAASIDRFSYEKIAYLVGKNPVTIMMKSGEGGSTPLHLACRHKLGLRKVRLLVGECNNIFKEKTTVGFTPLHTACYYDSSPQVIKFLLEKWKDAAKEVDARGRTPLDVYFAKDHRTMKTIQLLIEANPVPIETNPMDPFSFAELLMYAPHSDGQRLSRQARVTTVVL